MLDNLLLQLRKIARRDEGVGLVTAGHANNRESDEPCGMGWKGWKEGVPSG
jgi:hypothetical protein